MNKENFTILNKLANAVYDKKGRNILGLDLENISSIADTILIAEGNVERHVTAIAHHLISEMKEIGQAPVLVEGIKDGDWVVIDFGDVHVHLFTPELRERYQLEHLWENGKLVELDVEKEESSGVNLRRGELT